ncbi:MAG: hypothetical protein AABW81_02575 [Nanoarchaeota archaeon]
MEENCKNIDNLIQDLRLADRDNEFLYNLKKRSIRLYLSKAMFTLKRNERNNWAGVLNNCLDKKLLRGYLKKSMICIDVKIKDKVQNYEITYSPNEFSTTCFPFDLSKEA